MVSFHFSVWVAWVLGSLITVPLTFGSRPQNSFTVPKPRTLSPPPVEYGSCDLSVADRIDCGQGGINREACLAKGCCYQPLLQSDQAGDPNKGFPWCYHRVKQCDGYTVTSIDANTPDHTIRASLEILNPRCNKFGPNVEKLTFEATFESKDRIHVRILDREGKRWQVPEDLVPRPGVTEQVKMSGQKSFPEVPKEVVRESETLRVHLYTHPFGFAIVRLQDKQTLFNSTEGQSRVLIFEDQYIELSTGLPVEANIYGLGEVVHSLRLDPNRSRLTVFTRDAATPVDENLYGAHPFYMEVRKGYAHGVLLLNSNGMDVTLSPGSLTYKIIGGILDFYFISGPTPAQVVEQYTALVGRPAMMPYWSLGFHQCRFGYRSIDEVEDVVDNYRRHNIPLDAMWTDIDYMDAYKDFTFDPINYAVPRVRQLVDKLHERGQRYVLIIDPGIKVERGLKAFDEGIDAGIFMRNGDGSLFTGKVWPGLTHFPDFMHPRAQAYWTEQLRDFFSKVDVDGSVKPSCMIYYYLGLWVDMNEIANFCDGDCYKAPKQVPSGKDLNFPPYKINNAGNELPLFTRTSPMDALHYGNVTEYDAHNLYGFAEAKATYQSLLQLRSNERPFVLSRSTFPGLGRYAAHWTGDNWSNWDHLFYSIPGMLNFNFFGIPMVGADICGFLEDTTEELCARWMALGSFYPFSRNHNTEHTRSQEPYLFPRVAEISRKYLNIRYQLLPLWYTLLYQAHQFGSTIVRPLFFEFPFDEVTYRIDRQFLVGDALLVSPALYPRVNSIHVYFPNALWYSYDTFQVTDFTETGGQWIWVDTPVTHVPVHIRGGSIVPRQGAALTTVAARKQPFNVLVALDKFGRAKGDLYLDDGLSVDVGDGYSYIHYEATFEKNGTMGQLQATASHLGYRPAREAFMEQIIILGAPFSPAKVTLEVDGNELSLDEGNSAVQMIYDAERHVITLSGLTLSMQRTFKVTLNALQSQNIIP